MKQVTLEGFLKKHRDISRTIAAAKMEIFVALVSIFQPVTNFTKNSSIGVVGVLNAMLEYYNVRGGARILKNVPRNFMEAF